MCLGRWEATNQWERECCCAAKLLACANGTKPNDTSAPDDSRAATARVSPASAVPLTGRSSNELPAKASQATTARPAPVSSAGAAA